MPRKFYVLIKPYTFHLNLGYLFQSMCAAAKFVLVCRNIKKFEKCCPNPNPVVANLWHLCQRWHSSPSLWAHTP